MTRLGRWLRRKAEEFAGTYAEGPHPPDRFSAQVASFAEFHKHATRQEWATFALEFARDCYRAGYSRGYEHCEREDDGEKIDPDALMDAMDPGWREWSAPIDLSNPDVLVPEVRDELATFAESLGERRGGGWRR